MKLPIFIENSKIPVWLSYLSPINIGAITFGPLVISRGTMGENTRRHESIHWEQYKECLIIGFLLLYLAFWIRGIFRGYGGDGAYMSIPFEREAYDNEEDTEYLADRSRYAWRHYL